MKSIFVTKVKVYTKLTAGLKSDSHLPKIMKNAFYFILKALFVLKILKFLSNSLGM